MAGKARCMVMRVNLDCNACCRKMRRILLNMKEIETHLIEKQQYKVSVCGRFDPANVAIKIRKKMKRRVEILEIQELSNVDNGFVDEMHHFLPQPVSGTLLYN
ncbi:heavy metal-associated isoprenylated plant protein 19 [Primulina eburnea]|uniref:heavy metal-associated isoprenylated plant protein 19 n=1 Tax=Primulina eburnea TaxID=1245227 RepID=UPI003C6C2A18